MPYNHANLRHEIRDVINATLPELTIVLDAQQGQRRNYAGIELPCCVSVRGRSEAADWGIGNLAYERTFSLLLLYPWQDAEIDAMEMRLEVLKSALFAASYSTSGATLLSEPEVDVTPENPASQIILGKNLQISGGTLTVRYVCGETAF
jgi:uncharacterized membrane-anchored protein